MRKIALYARVSTEDQDLDTQLYHLEKYAKDSGMEYDIYKEKESTRKTRPVKQDLLQKLRNREYSAVIVMKIDRWARSVLELSTEIVELHEKGINFISLRDNIDLNSSIGKFQFHIIASLAEFEREMIRDRSLEGQARARAQGKHMGRPKGKKDSKPRKKSGYWLRWQNT